MQKKMIYFFCLCALVITNAAYSYFCVPKWVPPTAPELKLSYYYPDNRAFRHLFSNSFMVFDFDLNVRVWKNFWFWGGVGYFQRHGFDNHHVWEFQVDDDKKIIPGSGKVVYIDGKLEKHHKSLHLKASVIPYTLGFKYYCPIAVYVDLYGGVGARWNDTYIRYCHDHLDVEGKKIKRRVSQCGLALIGGFRFFLDRGAYATPFVEYSINHVRFSLKHDSAAKISNLGAFKIGLGLGYVI